MKRGPKSEEDTEKRATLIKKTFLFPRTTSQHLALAAMVLGVEQADIVREAVNRKLHEMGLDITQPPKLPRVLDVDNLREARG
jgi:hypothetical protein